MQDPGVTLCAILRAPAAGLAGFQAYEDAVLPLLSDHGGVLQRRLHTGDGLTEINLIWFPSVSLLDAYRADPRRAGYGGLFVNSGVTAEILTECCFLIASSLAIRLGTASIAGPSLSIGVPVPVQWRRNWSFRA
jgi:hypothetical protein